MRAVAFFPFATAAITAIQSFNHANGMQVIILIVAWIAIMPGVFAGNTFVLAIGLNQVDPTKYKGWAGKLDPCEKDAAFYSSLIPDGSKVEKNTLLTKAATVAAVKEHIRIYSTKAKDGDLVVIGYSGHGSQVFDSNGDEKENSPIDLMDETWCLYDRELIDDELFDLWRKFAKGVSIVVISDSCHSGTMTKEKITDYLRTWSAAALLNEAPSKDLPKLDTFGSTVRSKLDLGGQFREAFGVKDKLPGTIELPFLTLSPSLESFKAMPPRLALDVAIEDKDYYSQAQKELTGEKADLSSLQANVVLLAACQETQTALAPPGLPLSLFTYFMSDVWADGKQTLTYKQLMNSTIAKLEEHNLTSSQLPKLYILGPDAVHLVGQLSFR